MTERLTMVNRGRSLIGAGRLNSEADPQALTSLEIYDTIVEDLLSKKDWSFSTPVRMLARLTAAPGPDEVWSYQYQLPSDRIGPLRAVYNSKDWTRPFTAFELRTVDGDPRLLTDAEMVFARYPCLTSMSSWPGYFRKLIAEACAAHYALSVREDQSLHLRLMASVYGPADAGGIGGKVGDAMALDAQGRPSPAMDLDDGPLIAARRGA